MLSGTRGGGFHTAVVWYSFTGYPFGAAYTAECGTLGAGVVAAVGREVGLGLCCTDSQVAACQFLLLRASTWLNQQQHLLRALVLHLVQHPLIVEVRLVPGFCSQLVRPVGWIRIISRVHVTMLIVYGAYCLLILVKCNRWVG